MSAYTIQNISFFRYLYHMRIILSFYACLFLVSCITAPNYSDIPEISFVRFDKDTISQGIGDDFVQLELFFTDGDGDIGFAQQELKTNLQLIDRRTGNVYDNFKIPEIPPEGTGNGIEGTMYLRVFNTCCLYDIAVSGCEMPNYIPSNELSFDVQLTDRAGNQSNIVTTGTIILTCD